MDKKSKKRTAQQASLSNKGNPRKRHKAQTTANKSNQPKIFDYQGFSQKSSKLYDLLFSLKQKIDPKKYYRQKQILDEMCENLKVATHKSKTNQVSRDADFLPKTIVLINRITNSLKDFSNNIKLEFSRLFEKIIEETQKIRGEIQNFLGTNFANNNFDKNKKSKKKIEDDFDSSDDECEINVDKLYPDFASANKQQNTPKKLNKNNIQKLVKRLDRFSKKLKQLGAQKNEPLFNHIYDNQKLLDEEIKNIKTLQQRSNSIDSFNSKFDSLSSAFDKYDINESLQELQSSKADNKLLNKVFAKKNKIFNWLKRDFTSNVEFSEDSDSEEEAPVKTRDELRKEKFKKIIQRQKNLDKAKSGGKNLEGIDLSGSDLSGINLENTNLKNANLTGTKLNGANLKGADLTDAEMQNVDLTNADLIGANLTNIDFKDAIFNKTNLSKAILTRANFSEAATWNNVKLDNVKEASEVNFAGLMLLGIEFYGTNFINSNFKNSKIINCSFKNVNLNDSDFTFSQFENVKLNNSEAIHANFSNSKLQRVRFVRVVFNDGRAPISESYKNNSDNLGNSISESLALFANVLNNISDSNYAEHQGIFLNCNFMDVDFLYANLNSVNFTNSILKSVMFSTCKLNNIDFKNIKAIDIRFENTSLFRISFKDSILKGLFIKESVRLGSYLDFEDAKIYHSTFQGRADNKYAAYQKDIYEFFAEDVPVCVITSSLSNSNFKNTTLTDVKFSYVKFIGDSNLENIHENRVEFYYVFFATGNEKNIFDGHNKVSQLLKAKGSVVNGRYNEAYTRTWNHSIVMPEDLKTKIIKTAIVNLGTTFIIKAATATTGCTIL